MDHTNRSLADPSRTKDDRVTPKTKKEWTTPTVKQLPRLTDLTLQIGSGIIGNEGIF